MIHRLDGLDPQRHYSKVAYRIFKYGRRLIRMGFVFDKTNNVFHKGDIYALLEYIEDICDFTEDEFNERYKDG